MATLSIRLLERIPDANALYHRLVLAVGPARSGKTEALTELAASKGWPRVNVNLQLAERLLDLTQKQRAVRVAGLLDDIAKSTAADVVLLDNIEMLFAVEFAQDPLRLLQGLSRNRTGGRPGPLMAPPPPPRNPAPEIKKTHRPPRTP